MPTSDDLKQRLNAAASQEQSEFAMALLISEVIDAQLTPKNPAAVRVVDCAFDQAGLDKDPGLAGLFLSCRFWWSGIRTC